MIKWLKWAGIVLVIAFAGLQFFNPAHINPPADPARDVFASNPPPPEITAILKNSCYNCHSYKTEWPFYSYVAPFSWLVVRHVNDARDALNFSDWPNDNPHRVRKRWQRVSDEVDAGTMPLASYTLIHRSARLTPDQRRQLAQWAEQAGHAPEN